MQKRGSSVQPVVVQPVVQLLVLLISPTVLQLLSERVQPYTHMLSEGDLANFDFSRRRD